MSDNKVKRYHAREIPDLCSNGQYVMHSDYAALEADRDRLKEQVAILEGELAVSCPDCNTDDMRRENAVLLAENARLRAVVAAVRRNALGYFDELDEAIVTLDTNPEG